MVWRGKQGRGCVTGWAVANAQGVEHQQADGHDPDSAGQPVVAAEPVSGCHAPTYMCAYACRASLSGVGMVCVWACEMSCEGSGAMG